MHNNRSSIFATFQTTSFTAIPRFTTTERCLQSNNKTAAAA